VTHRSTAVLSFSRRTPASRFNSPPGNTQEESMQVSAKLQEYWRRNLNLTGMLLVVWFVVTFVLGYFARDLSFNFFGWPFSFYMGAQGALIVYLLIIWYYASAMNKLDKEYGVDEEEIE
jgi:putative solute:sodium symporter small subunit